MHVLLISGSPRNNSCTYTALHEIAMELERHGITWEIYQIGTQDIHGCIACGDCRKTGKCVYDDCVNLLLEKAKSADGFFFGSPVYYASANGSMVSLMDRLFYAGSKHFAYKPGACVVSARRGGTTATYDLLNKYIGISNMVMVPSRYWNMVHGNKPEDVLQDQEGLQIMRHLGANMAWLLKLLEEGKKQGISLPESEEKIATNFIR